MYSAYIQSIIVVKIIFVFFVLVQIYLLVKGKKDSEMDKKIKYWKNKFENVFKLLMALLLIFLFNPGTDRSVLIDKETKILLFLFGIILIITEIKME
jgi:L-asparagine transporter-like permease